MTGAAKRVVLETLGWVLLVLGVAAIFLPGPGLLGIFAGLALLSQQYEWAERRVEPVKLRAMVAAAEGVANWLRIALSLIGVAILVGCGLLWIAKPPAPDWWPVAETWWLPGGLWTGLTQIVSGAIALALIAYSYRRFHGNPVAVRELHHAVDRDDADDEQTRSA